MQTHGSEWHEYFVSIGYPEVWPLAAGIEGVVYRLGCGLIGKVWARRAMPELVLLQRFYRDIVDQRLRFATPEIQDIVEVRGVPVTIERELPGRPLGQVVLDADADLSPAARRCILDVLAGLASVQETENMRHLAVLDESQSLWQGDSNWGVALIKLVERRVDHFGRQFRRRVEHFDAMHAGVVALLRSLDAPALSLIHGDLVPANILVDDNLRPTAVLDFGFLSTAGDPTFDAAITASITNMYGPHARTIEAQLDDALVAEFGHDRTRLLLYKAVYAIVTSYIYDPTGADGHTAWCINILQRNDVSALLLQQAR